MISLVEHRVSGRFRDQWIALASQVLGSAYNGVRHFFCDFLSALLSWQPCASGFVGRSVPSGLAPASFRPLRTASLTGGLMGSTWWSLETRPQPDAASKICERCSTFQKDVNYFTARAGQKRR